MKFKHSAVVRADLHVFDINIRSEINITVQIQNKHYPIFSSQVLFMLNFLINSGKKHAQNKIMLIVFLF